MFIKALGRRIAMCAALMLGAMSTAQAVPYYWDDWAGDPGYRVTDHYDYTHQLDGFESGSWVSHAALSIWLLDDNFFGDLPFLGDGQETVGFRFDGNSWGTYAIDTLFWIPTDFDFVVTSLLQDGLLNVRLYAGRGDFTFGGSRLQAWGDRASTSVPEPAALSLLSLGLLGLGFAARRRKV